MKALVVSSGDKFGRLIVVMEAARRKECGRFRRYMLVECECGKRFEVKLGSLPSGNTQSCGCILTGKKIFPDRKGVAMRALLGGYKHHAKKRNLCWELSEEQFRKLTSSPCWYTGRMPSNLQKASAGSEYMYNGIDRIDNSIGYTKENCVPCCAEINYAKRGLSLNDFLTLVGEVKAQHSV